MRRLLGTGTARGALKAASRPAMRWEANAIVTALATATSAPAKIRALRAVPVPSSRRTRSAA